MREGEGWDVGVRALGETAVDALLLPVFCEIGVVAKNLVRGIEVNCSSPMICEDFERKLGELPNTRELVLTEAALPLCYQHVEGVWDICDIVI